MNFTNDPAGLFFIIILFMLLISLILWLIFRHKHTWSEWKYEADNSCRQVRSCQTCKATKTRETPHNWGEWIYEADNSCRQIRSCQRCGQRDRQKEFLIKHNWGAWRYEFIEPQQQYASLVRQVYQILDEKFSDSDLRDVCIELWVDYEDLPGAGQKNKARDLVLHMERHHRIPELIKVIKKKRPKVSLEDSDMIKSLSLPEKLSTQVSFEVDPTLSCNQFRVCHRCKQEEHKEEHRWGEKDYESLTSCQLVRICQLCGKTEKCEEAPHKWSNWDYKLPSSCEQVKRCMRCGKEESGGEAPHKWSNWDYKLPSSCEQVKRCMRCGKEESVGEAPHDWSDWKYESSASCQRVRKCERCGKAERGEIEHKWSAWVESPTVCQQVRKCERCGKEEE